MPPWTVDPGYGEFANDPRLSDDEIRAFETWVAAGAPAGKLPKQQQRRLGASADYDEFSPDLMVTAPRPFAIPAHQDNNYQYLVIPLSFTTHDRWVRAAEIRPGNPNVVNYAVLYVRDAGSGWLRDASPGIPYAPSEPVALAEARSNTADMLVIYARGSSAMVCPNGMAKKIPAGADLVLQVHYARTETVASDQPNIRLAFASEMPKKRVLTLQIRPADFRIPAGVTTHQVSAVGTLQADALLLGLFPYARHRGVGFDFEVIEPNGRAETILKVKPFPFDWQLSYALKRHRMLLPGTRLSLTGKFDLEAINSYNLRVNPDTGRSQQSWEEPMIGFVDVAVETTVNQRSIFK